jgi:hypothetical protein
MRKTKGIRAAVIEAKELRDQWQLPPQYIRIEIASVSHNNKFHTSSEHGIANGQCVEFFGDSVPPEIKKIRPFIAVVAAGARDSFQVSLEEGGSVIEVPDVEHCKFFVRWWVKIVRISSSCFYTPGEHGLVNGHRIEFIGDSVPPNIQRMHPYIAVFAAGARDSFQVSLEEGGSVIEVPDVEHCKFFVRLWDRPPPPIEFTPYPIAHPIRHRAAKETREVNAEYAKMLDEQKKAGRDPALRNIPDGLTLWLSPVVPVDPNPYFGPLHVRWTMQVHTSVIPDTFWPNCHFTFEAVYDSVRVRPPPSENDQAQVTFISPEHVSIIQQHHCGCAERRIEQEEPCIHKAALFTCIEQHHCECNAHHEFEQTLRNLQSSGHSEKSWPTLELDVARYVQACPRCHTEPDGQKSFPQVAPHVTCKTPIYHPNISDPPSGKVCLSSLNNWQPATTLWHIIEAGLWCTQFQDPNGNDPLPDCQEKAELLLSDRPAFGRNAKSHAEKHKTFIPGSREHRGY